MNNVKNIATKYFLKDNNLFLDDKKYILKIKDLKEDDKPRERLIKNGPEVLKTVELLAIILNAGTRKEEVFAMSSRILKEYGEKNISNQSNVKLLAQEIDIPLVKACQIVACFELGKRFFKEKPGSQITLRTAKQAFDYLKDMRNLQKEQLRGLYLNSRYRLIHDEVISVGSLTTNVVHPREVFKPALEYSAVAIIIAHNHPSGSVKATRSDIETTNQLIEASRIIGIDLLDHLIIAGNRFASVPVKYE